MNENALLTIKKLTENAARVDISLDIFLKVGGISKSGNIIFQTSGH